MEQDQQSGLLRETQTTMQCSLLASSQRTRPPKRTHKQQAHTRPLVRCRSAVPRAVSKLACKLERCANDDNYDFGVLDGSPNSAGLVVCHGRHDMFSLGFRSLHPARIRTFACVEMRSGGDERLVNSIVMCNTGRSWTIINI